MTTTAPSADLIKRANNLLEERLADEAFELLREVRDDSTAVQNARAVCLMRLGRAGEAARILSGLLFRPGTVAARPDAPRKLKLNYATCMLLTGNVAGALAMLDQVEGESPSADRLRAAIRAWRKGRPIWSRLAMGLGILPYDTPVPLDFPPGEL